MANLTFTVNEVLQKVGTLQLRVDQLERELDAARAENKSITEDRDRWRARVQSASAQPESRPDDVLAALA